MDVNKVDNNDSKHRFEIQSDGEVAFMSYRLDSGRIVLVHTEVPQALEGRGIASALAKGAFDYARSKHLQVGVVCPFVTKWLEKHPEQRDIVK